MTFMAILLASVINLRVNMKKIFLILSFLILNTAAYAGGNIGDCINCNITYNVTKKVVKKVVPAPAPRPMVPAVVPVAPVAPGYVGVAVPYVTGPAPVYAAPYYQQPVAATVNGQCAWYVDPYDLFGQLFGSPDLVQSCW